MQSVRIGEKNYEQEMCSICSTVKNRNHILRRGQGLGRNRSLKRFWNTDKWVGIRWAARCKEYGRL